MISVCSTIWTPIDQSYDYFLINVENLIKTWALKSACSSCIHALSGYMVSKEGKLADPKKILGVVHMPTPKTPKDIQVFNGMAHYY